MCISSYENTISRSASRSGPKVIKLFSCLTELSLKFHLLIKGKTVLKQRVLLYNDVVQCICPANKCSNANNCWHLNIYEHEKCDTQLKRKAFYNLRARIHNVFHVACEPIVINVIMHMN